METRRRILLIDDDPTFLRATSLALSEKYDVTCLSDTHEIDHQLKSSDVIVCDFKMQPNDGHEILRRIKKEGITAPVILVSAYANKEMAIAAANLHVFAILEKPFEIHALHELIGAACESLSSPTSSIWTCNETLTVSTDGGPAIRLTATEFQILSIFLEMPNKAVGRETLLEKIWGRSKLAENVWDTHLGNLKKKVPYFGHRLRLVRGRGYLYAQ